MPVKDLQVAEMALQAGLLNSCLQNAQQAVEKALKAVQIHCIMPSIRTHSIRDLNRDLTRAGILTGLTEEDCELLDSIYVSSKYPLDSVLPDALPDLGVSRRCTLLASQVVSMAENAATGRRARPLDNPP